MAFVNRPVDHTYRSGIGMVDDYIERGGYREAVVD